MNLVVQIYSFIYSFLFGIIFYFLLELFNKISFKIKNIVKGPLSFVFIFFISSLYFLGLLFINNGVVHMYFLLTILVGYVFVYFLFTHLKKK